MDLGLDFDFCVLGFGPVGGRGGLQLGLWRGGLTASSMMADGG
jgi:hypothetical protein